MSDGEPAAPERVRYELRLYIAGLSSRSQRTIVNLRLICRTHLAENFGVEIIDIYQQPELAERDQVVAAPTLVRLAPLPVRRIIGDLTDEARVLRGLGLPPRDT